MIYYYVLLYNVLTMSLQCPYIFPSLFHFFAY